jgi:phage repressor protein C with HTH and peptisase S24 domain
LGTRLKKERERLGLNQEALGKRAGVKRLAQVNYESGKRNPDADYLARVADAGADVLYIVTGKRVQVARGDALHEDRAGYVYLPLYEQRAAAGKGRVIDDNELVKDVLSFREDWIRREVRARPADLGLCFVDGHSNVPDMHPGDIVMFNRADTKVSRDSYYLVRMQDALLIKRLQHLPGGMVKVSSKNPDFEPFTIKVADIDGPENFHILGRIVWQCRRL